MPYTLSGGNATLWRTFPQKMEARLYLDVPPSVFKRRVNQSTFEYPVSFVNYDNPDGNPGSSTAVTAGLTIRVYHGTTGVLKGIIRARFASAGTITFAPVGPGVVWFEDNDILDVVDERRLWVEVPLIQPDGTILKDWGEGFIAAEAQPPVANAGPDIAGDVDSGTGLLTVEFDGTNSYPVADSAIITDYLWDVSDGTITVGTSADDAITATFPAGRIASAFTTAFRRFSKSPR